MSRFVHQELHTTDTKAAKKFYGKLFGWKFEDMKMPEGVYTMLNDAQGGFGGMVQGMPGVPPNWLGYIEVASVKKTVAKAKKLGGNCMMEHEVPGQGKFAIFTDPQGAAFAVWESTKPAPKKAAKKK